MLHIILYQPEIPPNTGNIIRLCHNTQTKLHLIAPLGFDMEDKQLRRAGLDYREWVCVQTHNDLQAFCAQHPEVTIIACSTKGNTRYDLFPYTKHHHLGLLFGPETRGLPLELIQQHASIFLPMCEDSRSLNLSNSVAVMVYEALRQMQFPNCLLTPRPQQ